MGCSPLGIGIGHLSPCALVSSPDLRAKQNRRKSTVSSGFCFFFLAFSLSPSPLFAPLLFVSPPPLFIPTRRRSWISLRSRGGDPGPCRAPARSWRPVLRGQGGRTRERQPSSLPASFRDRRPRSRKQRGRKTALGSPLRAPPLPAPCPPPIGGERLGRGWASAGRPGDHAPSRAGLSQSKRSSWRSGSVEPGQPCHLSLLRHHSPPPTRPPLGCWTPSGPESAHRPPFGATWSPARCPPAGRGPSQRPCGPRRAPSAEESANASVAPRATASLPRPTAAPTSSCTSPTWKGSTSRWKATRSPIRCAPSHPRTRSCRPSRLSSPIWHQAPNTKPGPATSSACRRGQKHPFSRACGRLWGRGGQD